MNFCLDDGNALEITTVESSNAKTLKMTENVTEQKISSGVNVIKRQIRKNTGSTSWNIEYPQIQGLSSQYIQTRINNYLRKQFTNELTEHLGEMKNSYEYEDHNDRHENNVTIQISYEICLLDDGIISIQRFFYQEAERAAHPNHYYNSLNIDLNFGYQYTYNDLFRLDSDYRTRIPEIIDLQLEDEITTEWEERDEFEFVLYKDNLEIINLFDSHVNRAVVVAIKYNDILDIIHPESPLGKYLSISNRTFAL